MSQLTANSTFMDFIDSLSLGLGVENPEITKYKNNPCLFFKEKLGISFWGELNDIVNKISLTQQTSTGTVPVHIPKKCYSVVAGHGVSKTYFAAALTLWWLYIHHDCLVLTTAPRVDQLETALWGYINTLFLKAKEIDPDFLGRKTRCLTKMLKVSDNRKAWGTTARPENADSLRGSHSPNLLMIVDESSGVDDRIFDALEGALSGSNAIQLLLSNPAQQSGYFFNTFSDDAFEHYHLSILDMFKWYEDNKLEIPAGVSSYEWVEKQRKKYGVNSPIYKMKVLGEFSSVGMGNTVIAPSCFDSNIALCRPADEFKGVKRLGVDIALMGNDSCVYAVCDDLGILEIIKREKQEPAEVRLQIADLAKKYNIAGSNINLDSTGLGATFSSDLKLLNNLDVNPINFANKPQCKDEYENISTEMYWAIREKLMNQDTPFYINYDGLGPIVKFGGFQFFKRRCP